MNKAPEYQKQPTYSLLYAFIVSFSKDWNTQFVVPISTQLDILRIKQKQSPCHLDKAPEYQKQPIYSLHTWM